MPDLRVENVRRQLFIEEKDIRGDKNKYRSTKTVILKPGLCVQPYILSVVKEKVDHKKKKAQYTISK